LADAVCTLADLLRQWGHDQYLFAACQDLRQLFEQHSDNDALSQRLVLAELLRQAINSNDDRDLIRQHAEQLGPLACLPGFGLAGAAGDLRERIMRRDEQARRNLAAQNEPQPAVADRPL
jgi:hypothetical protein